MLIADRNKVCGRSPRVGGERVRPDLPWYLDDRPLEEQPRMTRITDHDFRLRDHQTPPTLPTSPKLGLNLATLHQPELKLADYIHPQLANPPAAISRPHAGFSWGMLANDRIGDCVIAM